MNKRYSEKEVVTAQIQNNDSEISDEELKLINGYTRRELSKAEIYVFSVILCDNDIDRDGERFNEEALYALEKLFLGKTGIIDHNPSANNQKARIYECAVEAVEGMKTTDGRDYFRLKAKAYMPKTAGNEDIISAIDSGIIKEVSVGCAVEKTLCSICGEDMLKCSHKCGEIYNGKLCCGELVNPYDAYEWSFVAVPSQKKAGITKMHNYNGKDLNMDEILKNIEKGRSISLSEKECEQLKKYIENLRQSAKDGIYYRDSLSCDVLRLSASVQPDISRETMESVVKNMTVHQLKEFKEAFEKQKNKNFMPVPQLYGKNENKKLSSDLNGQFKI